MKPELVHIQEGTFSMGSDSGDERPRHEVTLDSFSIGKFPVSREEYNGFLQDTGHPQPAEWHNAAFSHPQQPVVGVSWYDAIQYCKWISTVYRTDFRLPTEAEWEFAATAGNPYNIYPWGNRNWTELQEIHGMFQNGPEPVQSLPGNSFGICGMGMNVHEWCIDWYASDYYYNSPSSNPTGPNNGKRRSSRGGSWRHQIKITRCAARSSIPPEYRYADYGFRVVSVSIP